MDLESKVGLEVCGGDGGVITEVLKLHPIGKCF